MHDMVERKITNNPSICISFVPPFSQTRPKMNFSGCPDRAFHFAPGIKFIAGPSESISSSKWIHLPQKQNPIWTFYKTLHPAKLNIPQMVGKMLAFSINAVILEILSYISGRPSHPRTLKKFVSPLDRGARGPNHPFSQSGKRCCTSTSDCRLLIFWATKKKKNMKYRWVYIGILVILHYCNIPT